MKNIILLFCILFITGCDYINNQINNSNIVRTVKIRENPKSDYSGNVKRIIQKRCKKFFPNDNSVSIEIDKSSCWFDYIKEFNLAGILVREIEMAGDDTLSIKNVKVNETRQIIEEDNVSINHPQYNSKTNFSYNNAGFETEEVKYVGGEFHSREQMTYDEFNCLIKHEFYDENNKTRNFVMFQYDNKNRTILSHGGNENVGWKYVTEYKNNDDNSSYTEYDYYDGVLKSKTEIKDIVLRSKSHSVLDTLYHQKIEIFSTLNFGLLFNDLDYDKLFDNAQYYSNGKIKSIYLHYLNLPENLGIGPVDALAVFGENERINEIKINCDGEWFYTLTWKYRDDGAVLEKNLSSSRLNGKKYFKITTYFSVDSNGNWTECFTKDSEGNIRQIAIREIEYY